jgi:hypothetical protein
VWPAEVSVLRSATAPKVSMAIAATRPEAMLTITALPDGFGAVQKAMNRTVEILRDMGELVDWFWVIEANPRGTGTHAHAFAHRVPDPERLQAAATRARLGHVHVSRTEKHTRTRQYLFTEVLRHPIGSPASQAAYRRHLDLNGGRAFHATRGFWFDASTGEKFPGIKAAIANVASTDEDWIFVHDSNVARLRAALLSSEVSGRSRPGDDETCPQGVRGASCASRTPGRPSPRTHRPRARSNRSCVLRSLLGHARCPRQGLRQGHDFASPAAPGGARSDPGRRTSHAPAWPDRQSDLSHRRAEWRPRAPRLLPMQQRGPPHTRA